MQSQSIDVVRQKKITSPCQRTVLESTFQMTGGDHVGKKCSARNDAVWKYGAPFEDQKRDSRKPDPDRREIVDFEGGLNLAIVVVTGWNMPLCSSNI